MPITPQQFAHIYPTFEDWVSQLLRVATPNARPVATANFERLPQYFSSDTLANAQFVVRNSLPTPPLKAWGFPQFAEFENLHPDGITYLNTYFVRPAHAHSERLHFHELIHVMQWSLLGAQKFVALYIAGLETRGYRESPLEIMAYDAEERFASDPTPFDAERYVATALQRI